MCNPEIMALIYLFFLKTNPRKLIKFLNNLSRQDYLTSNRCLFCNFCHLLNKKDICVQFFEFTRSPLCWHGHRQWCKVGENWKMKIFWQPWRARYHLATSNLNLYQIYIFYIYLLNTHLGYPLNFTLFFIAMPRVRTSV